MAKTRKNKKKKKSTSDPVFDFKKYSKKISDTWDKRFKEQEKAEKKWRPSARLMKSLHGLPEAKGGLTMKGLGRVLSWSQTKDYDGKPYTFSFPERKQMLLYIALVMRGKDKLTDQEYRTIVGKIYPGKSESQIYHLNRNAKRYNVIRCPSFFSECATIKTRELERSDTYVSKKDLPTEKKGAWKFQLVSNVNGLRARVTRNSIQVFRKYREFGDYYDMETPFHTFRKFLGIWTGFDNSSYEYHGNTLLVKLSKHKYAYIGRSMMTFSTGKDEIKDFIASMGNNTVPYPMAFGKTHVYSFGFGARRMTNKRVEGALAILEEKNDGTVSLRNLDQIWMDIMSNEEHKHLRKIKTTYFKVGPDREEVVRDYGDSYETDDDSYAN